MICLNCVHFLGHARPGSVGAFGPHQEAGLKHLVLHLRRVENLERFRLQPFDVRRAASWPEPAARCRWQRRNPCSRTPAWSARPADRASACSAQTASPRIVPALMCGTAGASEPEQICTVPASSASTASPPPLNTTLFEVRQLFAASSEASSCNCGVVPIGGVDAVVLLRIGARERDEILHRLRRQIRT